MKNVDQLVDLMDDVIIQVDDDLLIISANRSVEKIFKSLPNEMIGNPLIDDLAKRGVVFPFNSALSETLADQTFLETTSTAIISQHEVTLRWRVTRAVNEKTSLPKGFWLLISLIDTGEITAADILRQLPCAVFWKDHRSVFLGCNEAMADSININSPDDIIGKSDYDFTWKDTEADLFLRCDQVVMSSEKQMTFEEPLLVADGKRITLLTTKVPLYNKHKKLVGILGAYFDITSRKQAEAKSRAHIEKSHIATIKSAARIKLLASSIAHELRTPLTSIAVGIKGIEKFLPRLLGAYRLAEDNQLPVTKIRSRQLATLDQVANLVKQECRSAHMFVDMLLMNTRHDEAEISNNDFTELSIQSCLQEARDRYPFKLGQKSCVRWPDSKEDFIFYGNSLYTVHMLFNLLKNALYAIERERRGEIIVTFATHDNVNQLLFRDTACGLSNEDYDNIFKPFYSQNPLSAGIGLSFCKMVMQAYKGDITCDIISDECTLFTLSFPKIEVD